MKFVAVEPLGVEEETLRKMAERALPDGAEIVLYDTRTTDAGELIRRGKDADVIAGRKPAAFGGGDRRV